MNRPLTARVLLANLILMVPQEIMKLSPAERLQLVEDLWDSLTDLQEAIPVLPAQRKELDRRLDKYRQDPHGGIPWDEVKRQILSRG